MELNNMILSYKYKVIEKISEGCFGVVYKGINIRTNEYVAIKTEQKNDILKSLKQEAKIYQYLGNLDGFPQLKTYSSTDSFNYLIISLLGKSLSQIIQYYKVLSKNNVLIIGLQMLKRVQSLHERYLIHRDIKPSNFIFGIDEQENKLFMVDFGFAKRYDYDGKHIEQKGISKIIGSINFVSLNVHNLIEPSRRDDLESTVYIILYLYFGQLEWFHCSDIENIVILKRNIIYVDEVPLFIKEMLIYIRCLAFDETPDYKYLINILYEQLNKKQK
jgi:serine/threonine protein kinase